MKKITKYLNSYIDYVFKLQYFGCIGLKFINSFNLFSFSFLTSCEIRSHKITYVIHIIFLLDRKIFCHSLWLTIPRNSSSSSFLCSKGEKDLFPISTIKRKIGVFHATAMGSLLGPFLSYDYT